MIYQRGKNQTPRIDLHGNKLYYNDHAQLHRLDGPAVEYIEGTKLWFNNNRHHRLKGPAREWSDGSKEWWVNDKLHRLDGPAREWANGDRSWWIDYKELTQQQFERHPLVIFYRLTQGDMI
jgi:hypothetical protein